MPTFTFSSLIAPAVVLVAGAVHQASALGTLTGEIYNAAPGGSNYTNASSIPVSSTDAINGQAPIATNYVGCCEANGGTTVPLTDGSTGVGTSDPTSASNSLFDLNGPQPWYAEYDLLSAQGIGNVVVTTGHQDNRVNQHYDILLSTDGTTFTSLSDGSTQALGAAGTGFTYAPSSGAGGAAQSEVVDSGGAATLGTARYVEFVALNGGSDVFRELDVNTSAVPEPSTWVAAGGLLLLAAGDFRRRMRA